MLYRNILIACALSFFAIFSAAQAQERKAVLPEGAEPSPLYSPAIEADGFIFTSGQLGFDPKTGKLGEGFEAQTKFAMQNLKEVLEAAGSSLDDLVKVNIYLNNIDDYAMLNKIYPTYFKGAAPARTALQVGKLPLGGLIEIEGIAVKK